MRAWEVISRPAGIAVTEIFLATRSDEDLARRLNDIHLNGLDQLRMLPVSLCFCFQMRLAGLQARSSMLTAEWAH